LKQAEQPQGVGLLHDKQPHDAQQPQEARQSQDTQRAGRVYLVGAGPGDPGLLTARALELIASADTILYDRLIPPQALDGARADAELLFVGKQGGGQSVPQEQTQALMIERAREGREVVRLKGGDPFVFGRGGEEALALRELNIDFCVVPGVTAGVAASAYAGIPVTHRGLSTGVALVTGHTREDTPHDKDYMDDSPKQPEQELDWEGLAAFPGTLVFYMGVRALERIASSLIAAGRSPAQAVAVIERGTLPDQRTVMGTLATIAELATREEVKAPAITIVGEVVELGTSLAWLEDRPLAGRKVAVTRARTQASGLAQRLTELGATVVQAPVIRTNALSGPAFDPAPYDLICLTSPNGVRCLFERLDDGAHPHGDARALANARIAAIGPGTAGALAGYGIVADVVPERFVAESLLDALSDLKVKHALVATASGARDVLANGLRARGAEVDVLALYETVAEPLSESTLAQALAADYITFTSSSSVRFFLGALRARARVGPPNLDNTTTQLYNGEPSVVSDRTMLAATARIVSIGPVTSATLREHGLEPHVEAERHDVDGLVDALLADTLACLRSSGCALPRGARSG
jgi:uroporphyrinogen III methyltransferase/synthase